MVRYNVRLLDSQSGAEGQYSFDHRADLMERPGDEIVAAFFEHADRELMNRGHVDYELNGVVKNRAQKTVVAIGSLHRRENGDHDEHDKQPFTVFISAA